MNFRNIILAAFLICAVTAQVPLKGTKGEGEACTAQGQCLDPYYCLETSEDGAFVCAKKTCTDQDMCRIGQYCDLGAQKCAVKACTESSECALDTVCQTNGFCGQPSNKGQDCAVDAQCWSKACSEGFCVDGPATDGDEAETVDKSSKLGGGAIAGIIIGILLLLAILAACCCALGCGKKKSADDEEI